MPEKLLYTRRESAEALNMSLSHFQRHVQHRIRWVYWGQKRLCPPSELERVIAEELEEPESRR
jgi:hypothetical protein